MLPAAHIPSTRLLKQKERSVLLAPVCKDLESEGVEKNKIEEVIMKFLLKNIFRLYFVYWKAMG